MRILGIDPGTARMGFGIIDSIDGSLSMTAAGCIKTSKDEEKGKRLEQIYRELHSIIEQYRPDMVIVEMLFFNKNTKTALIVGEARGIVLLAAAQCNLPVHEYTPLQVKESLTGYGRASKEEIRELVMQHLRLEKLKGTDDTADALAIALCHVFYMETGDFR